jgi:2'-5' RNA ligase
VRLFTAIELPEPVKAHLASVRAKLENPVELGGAISWVKPENVHVTLKFFGEVPDAAVGELIESLNRVIVEPMNLAADRMVYFPKRGPVRVIAAGIGGSLDKLARVYEQIEDASAALGFARERRAYTPHATLGRARITRRGGGVFGLRDATLDEAFPGPKFKADGFTLMRSDLKPTGAIYTPAAHFPLKSGT